jgi:CubicO group peptidase (beta-lactamase class C family)
MIGISRMSCFLSQLGLLTGLLLINGCGDDMESDPVAGEIEVALWDQATVVSSGTGKPGTEADPMETDPGVPSSEDAPMDEAPKEEEPEQPLEGDPESPVLSEGECAVPGPYPGDQWLQSTAEDQGMDSYLLDEAASFAGNNDSYCMVVVRHGHIVGEWYWQGKTPVTPVKSWSVGKSYSAAVTGIALDRGDLFSVDEPASNYIPQWQGTPKDSILIRDILSMSSGLKFKLIADNLGMSMAKDMTKLALNNPLVNTPGTLWEYNNHTVQVIEPVLRNATGFAPDEYADMFLWQPIGMEAEWARDKTGHPAMYMNVQASCRDHARFGYLHLKKGCWDGAQVISEEWVEESTSPSTTMNKGYGYWWWLNGEMPLLDSVSFSEKPSILHPFAPHDAFCAVGLGSQMIEVIPSLDMVVVRMGPAPHEHQGVLQQPLELIGALIEDGKQVVHNGVLERVLKAVVK